MLRWRSHEHIVGALCAIGARGVYSILRLGREWVLIGVGHDDLPLLTLPAMGKPFGYLEAAQLYATELDRSPKSIEAQASGV